MVPYTPTQTQVLHRLAQQARKTYCAEPDRQRIARAVQLILDSRAVLADEGTVSVLSSDGVTTYHANGSCQCPDYTQRGVERCKHRFCASLLRRLYRTYNVISLTPFRHGIGWITPVGTVSFLADDSETITTYDEAQIVKLGLVMLAEDENLVALACSR